MNNLNVSNNETKIIKTDIGAKDGQNKCPKCGATDIETNPITGKLRCNFCRYEFDLEKLSNMVNDLNQLQGEVIGSGAQNIVEDTNSVVTFKCSSCGAEVVVDTASASQARCHWCRNILSVNNQIPNGSIPDVVLPFKVTKEEAQNEIRKFVKKRNFFANPKFKKEFQLNNIIGVYFPYMLVDVNGHARLIGEGEHLKRKYYRGSGDNQECYYDADVYHVERDFDITINGLSIESNSDRLNNLDTNKTNNVINAIMPFDVENCVKYNANYLRGYTSEKRNLNVEELKSLIGVQSKDIVRFAANDSLNNYDRGVHWDNEELSVKGQQWKAAYLPVWLYSYQQIKGNKKVLHYVAVNGRTKETMGSVPIHMPKLIITSILIEFLSFFVIYEVDFEYEGLLLLTGIVFYVLMYLNYRNLNKRHNFETETKKNVSNLKTVDDYKTTRTGLSNSMMENANNRNVNGQNIVDNVISQFDGKKIGENILNTIVENNSVEDIIRNNINKL